MTSLQSAIIQLFVALVGLVALGFYIAGIVALSLWLSEALGVFNDVQDRAAIASQERP